MLDVVDMLEDMLTGISFSCPCDISILFIFRFSRHFTTTQHTYSMQVGSNRVWDYAGDNYVHRLLQNKADGKLVQVDEAGRIVSCYALTWISQDCDQQIRFSDQSRRKIGFNNFGSKFLRRVFIKSAWLNFCFKVHLFAHNPIGFATNVFWRSTIETRRTITGTRKLNVLSVAFFNSLSSMFPQSCLNLSRKPRKINRKIYCLKKTWAAWQRTSWVWRKNVCK